MAALLPEIQQLAMKTSKNLKWHVIASIALAGSNVSEEAGQVLRYAIQHDANGDANGPTAQRIARETRDGLIKSGQLIGFPKVLDALAEISTIQPLAEDDPSSRTRSSGFKALAHCRESDAQKLTPDQIRARGWEYWQKIYTSGSQSLLDGMHRAYPDMAYYAVSHVYGPLMSFFDVLDEMQTSFVMIAALIPGGHNKQLKGHLQGALNNGATKEEVKAVREIAMRLSEQAGMRWRKEIVDLD